MHCIGRGEFLSRGGALVLGASGLGVFAPAALAGTTPPDGDLAYLRLLIAGELLAVDFYGQAFEHGDLRRPCAPVAHRIRADEREHYKLLAAQLTAAGQTPATAGDIDFSYPARTFASRRSVLSFAKELERVLTGAYIDAVEHVQTPGYRETMARIIASEAQHHGAIAALEGEPVIGRRLPSPFRMDAMSNFLGNYES
jgi:rubrerythrin